MSASAFNDSIPQLNIEVLDNGCIRLENESMGDTYAVDIHPIHLSLIAEKTGLVPKLSASHADTLRTVCELRRRLMSLKDRIDHLGEYLALHSDHRHADLSYESTYATATADICEAYCSDLSAIDPPANKSAPIDVTPSGAQSSAGQQSLLSN